MKKHQGANIVEPIREPEKIQEMKDVLLHQSYRNYFLFTFGINSGLRISDMLPLRVMDVRNTNHLRISEKKKSGKIRKIPVTPTLRNEIDKYTSGMADSDFLFPSRKGTKPITREAAWKIINDAATACGIEGPIGTHTMRKTFGYHFYKQTKDVAMLQKVFGHSSPSVTLRYIGINDDMIEKAFEEFSL